MMNIENRLMTVYEIIVDVWNLSLQKYYTNFVINLRIIVRMCGIKTHKSLVACIKINRTIRNLSCFCTDALEYGFSVTTR